jgi:hypothetical protein
VLVQLLALCHLSETYHPKILAKKAKNVRNVNPTKTVYTIYDEPGKKYSKIVRKRLILPFQMILFHPAVQAPSIYRAFLYGIMYLVLSTFQTIWEGTYGLSTTMASLNYLSLGLGFIIGLQLSHPLMDKVSVMNKPYSVFSPADGSFQLYAFLKVYYNTEEGVAEW